MYDRSNTTAYLDARMAGERLEFRSIEREDRFQPLGSMRDRSLWHFLKSQKVEDRERVGVVASGEGEILWIPRVAVSQKCRITDKTDSIIKISYQEAP